MPKKLVPRKEGTDHSSGWRIHQRSRKIKKKTKLALFVLGSLVSLLLLSQLVAFTKLIHRPFKSQDPQKNYTWNNDFNLNFVLKDKSISLVSYNPQERKVTILAIPDETYIEVGGFGKWQVRSIYDLGESSKLGGDKLLKQSTSSFLGLPVDGFLSVDEADVFDRNPLSFITLLPKIQTDLTLWELAQLKWRLLAVRFDKIKWFDLSKLEVLSKEKLLDDTEVFVADPVRVDGILSDFKEPKLVSEHLSIAIFNATDTPFLAQKAKRLITNMGGNVIAVLNAPAVLQKSYVEGLESKTLWRLTQIFDLDCQVDPKCDKIPRTDLGPASRRAQIIVVLGQDSQ